MKTRSLTCGVLFILALGGRIGLAATLTWTGAISTDWNNATNWTPQQVPAATDHVIINSGSVTIPTDGAFAIMDWAGGSISGSLTVANNGVLNVNGSADVGLYGPLTNSGTINWTGTGRWYVYNNNGLPFTGAIYNLAGALFDIQNDQPMYGGNGNEFINNAGTVRKSAGTNTTTLQVAFNNTDTVNVLQGTLVLGLGGSLGGQFTTTNGTAINLAGGNFTEAGLPVFSGGGQSQITGGYLTLTTDTIAGLQLNGGNLILTPAFQGGSITNLTLSGSVLVSTNTVTGTFNWTGGSIGSPGGALTVAGGGLLNVSGSNDKFLYGPLTNSGTINWTGAGRWYVYNNNGAPFTGAIYNLPGGLIDIQNDQPMYGGNGNEFINNAGTVRKSASTNTTTLQIAFNNTGTVNVLQGTLAFGAGGTVGGQFTTAVGTTINLAGGIFTEAGLPVFSGGGQGQFTAGQLTLAADVIAGLQLNGGNLILTPAFQGGSITNLTLSGSVLTSTNTVTGTFNWTGGNIGYPSGALTVAGNGVLNVGGSNDKTLYGPLTNSGTINWTGVGRWYVYNNNGLPFTGAIYNLPGGLIDIQNDEPMYGGDGNEFINNAGTVRKSASTNTTTLYVALDNSGTVEVDNGIVSLQSAYSDTSSANLTFSLGGAAPGSGYGNISFNTPLAMNGTFTARTRNGYLPSPGTAFLVMSFPSSTNSFTCLSGLDLGGGILLQPQFDSTDLTLLATAYTTNASQPQLFINQNIGSVVIAWPTGFPGWTLQSTTNLSSPAWTTVSNTCDNQVILSTSFPRQYFRLHNGN